MLVYVESWNTGEPRTTGSVRSHRASLAATRTTATQLRGGGDGDYEEVCNDQELDAYIEFLLAEAENEAVENPFAPLQEIDVVTSSTSTTTQQQYDESSSSSSSSSSSREQDAGASNAFNLLEIEEIEAPIAVDEEMELDHDASGDSDSEVDQPNEEDPLEEEVQNIVEDVLLVVQDSSMKVEEEEEELLQRETPTTTTSVEAVVDEESTTATEQPEFFLGPSAVEQVHPLLETKEAAAAAFLETTTPATTNDTTTHPEEIEEEAAAAITAAAEENEVKDSEPSFWTNLVQRVSKSPDKEQTVGSILLNNDDDDVDDDVDDDDVEQAFDDVEQAFIMAGDVLATDDVSSSLPPESESHNMNPSKSQIQEQQQEAEEELVLGDDDNGMQDKQLLPLLDEEEEESTIELKEMTKDKPLEEESSPIELEMEEDYNVDDEILEDPKKEALTPTSCTQAEPVAAKETVNKEASERNFSIERRFLMMLEPEMIDTNDITSINPADDDVSTEHAAKPSISIWQRFVKRSLETIEDDSTSGNKSEETGATESSLENGDATIEMETRATVGDVVDESTPLRSPRNNSSYASEMMWTLRDRYNRGWGTLQNFVNKKCGDSESKEVTNAATDSTPEEKPVRDYSKIYVKYFETTQSTDLPGATREDSMSGAAADPAKGRGWGSWGRKLAFFSRGSSKGDDDYQKTEVAESEPSNLDPFIEFEANDEEDPMAPIDESTSATVEEEVEEDGPALPDDVDGSTLAEYVDELDITGGVEEGSSLQVDQRETVVIEEDHNFEEEILVEGTTDPSPKTVEEDSQQSAPMRQWVLTLEREEDSTQDPAREQSYDLLQLSDQVEKDESMYEEISEQTEESLAPILEADVIDSEGYSDGPKVDDRPIDRIEVSSKPPAPTRKWVLTLERAQHSDIVRAKESLEETNESNDVEKTSIIEEISNDVENLCNTEIEDEEGVLVEDGLVEGSESTEIGEEEDSLVVEEGLTGMDRYIQFEEDDDDIHLLLDQYDDDDDSNDENEELNSNHAPGNAFASFLPTEIDNNHCTASDYSLPAVGTLTEVHTSDEMDAIELPIDSEVEEVATFEVPSTSVELSDTSGGGSLNVFSRFLVKHGLESLLMVTIVFIEWFKVYLYPPVFELLDWVLQKQPPPLFHHDSLLSKFLGTRGGANEVSSDADAEENLDVDELDQNDLVMGSNLLPGERDGDQVEKLGSVAESENEDSEITKTVDEQTPEEEPNEADSNYTESTSSLPALPRARPNLMHRYLLGYGQVGHSLIMISVFWIEWVYTYLPILASLLDVCKHQVLQGKYGLRGEEEATVSQTTGFVDESGSAVRGGKKRKGQTRKDDQRALSQLQQIGDVSQARYRFVSDHFMRRHAIGPYAGATALVEVEEILEKPYHHNEESDGDWVVEALTQKDPEQSSIDTSVGVSYGSDGASLSVGVEFDFGGKRKKQKKRPSISEVARQTSASSKSKKPTGPRVSDRESGVMGRIRAAGANSLVGRSLLGAYPGDAPAPVDAADANGMVDVAMKYGYGDWSDGDDEHTAKSRHRRKRRNTSSGARRTRERSSSIGINFDFGSSSSSSRKTRKSPARHKTKSTSESQSELKSGKSRHRKRRRTKPMELQNEDADGSTVVGPALDFLNETAEAKSNDGLSEATKVRKTRNIKRSPQESPNKNKVVGPAIDMLEKALEPKANPEPNN